MVASRPQAARGGGLTTVHIWLIVFVALWLISTVLAVLLYTGRERLVQAAESAEQEAEKYMRSNEAARFNVFLEQAGDRLSLAAVLDNERIAMARLIGVDETVSAVTAAKQVNEVISSLPEGAPPGAELPDLEGMDLLTVVNTVRDRWISQAQAVADLRKQLDTTIAKMKGQTATDAAKQNEYEQTFTQLQKQDQQRSKEKAEQIDAKNEQVKDLQQQVVKTQDTAEERIVKLRRQLRQQEEILAGLKAKLKETQEQLSEFRPKVASVDMATRADGKILRAPSEDDMVYIDLAKGDHLTLGLRFQVFSASVEVDPSGQGKATIEVVGIGDEMSECRIVESQATNPIMAGDYIVNVVYDKTRKYKFVVEGGFDVNGDGRYDPQDTFRIKSWIKAWGGEVVELPETPPMVGGRPDFGLERVDFVVLGVAPPKPPKEGTGRVKEEDRTRRAAMRQAHGRFMAIKQEAKDLSLAILTESQFLHFIGHGQDAKGGGEKGAKRTAMGQ